MYNDCPRIYAASAEIVLIVTPWTEAGPVNGARSKIDRILKLVDDRKARIVMRRVMVDSTNYGGHQEKDTLLTSNNFVTTKRYLSDVRSKDQ
jgi:hypothetical protein